MEAVKTNPYKTLIGQLLGWLHQLPFIGFNSGKYDLNVIKQFFVPYPLKPSKQEDNDDTTGSIYYNYYNRLILCLDCSFCVKCTQL